ncbi:MAG: ABC transporter substrate-binding protein [Candidatus Bipolaricaulota bacterium]|nr:ABC transporter substrate-binding protein [Candidatus Bipolaricaulota bacterium]
MKKLVVAALLVTVAFAGLAQRTGAWVDEVVFFEEPTAAKAVEMVRTGAADVYTFGVSTPAVVKTITETVGYEVSYGSYNEITFNPYGPEFADGRLNPFAVPAVREAMNWLIDRDYIIQQFYAGVAGVARWFPITPSFPDYAKLADVARRLELQYGYNLEKAQSVIAAEMQKLGATLVGGKWHYKGKPVEVICLIRVEDERRQIGDYVADQLEKIGFVTRRDYKTAAEASPIWISGDPKQGLFHVYTGGWVTTVVDRDQADNWDYFYTPRGRTDPLWQAYKPAPEADQLWNALAMGQYSTAEERLAMMAKAMELGLKDSVRVWVANRVSYFARNKNLAVASDLAGGVYGAWLWSRTLKWKDKVGGTVLAAQASMLTEPWNAIAGTNWIFDQMIIRGVSDYATLPDPFTGLYWPQNVEKVELTIVEGQPSFLTLELGKDFGGGLKGWVTQTFAKEIVVPGDAWADWDAKTQTFITAEKRFGGKVTAKSKAVVTYPASVFDRLWHDGSKMSLGDMILSFILNFDRAKPDSKIYDAAAEPAFKTFMGHFKGLKILSTSPKVVFEVYSDLVYLDAELTAASRAGYLWPAYGFGVSPWHGLTLGLQADGDGKLAFGSAKAKARGIEWMSYIAGPSLAVLKGYLDENAKTGYIPYAPTLGKYITEAEAKARYANLQKFYATYGHFWVANGPLYVDKVDTVTKTIITRRFAGFTDLATKWEVFAQPKVAAVKVTAPATVTRGSPATFTVDITFQDKPYELAQLDFVKYMLFDGAGNFVGSGNAVPVKDGQYKIELSGDVTRGLAGACKIEVVVVSKVVGMPSFASVSFVVR